MSYRDGECASPSGEGDKGGAKSLAWELASFSFEREVSTYHAFHALCHEMSYTNAAAPLPGILGMLPELSQTP